VTTPRRRILPWIVAAFLAAALGGVGSASAGSFYLSLDRPWWAPPVWLFGPAWTVLYVLMALSAARVDAALHPDRMQALGWWWVQLAANIAWTWCFFVFKSGALAMLDAVLLWSAVALTLRFSARVDRPAGWMLAPYLAWVSYACLLTWSVWRRNPTVL
jgi:tryptophan-rich sensory protein